MKNVSNAYRKVIEQGGPFYLRAKVTLADSTVLELTPERDFQIDGNGIVQDGGSGFPLGVAVSKTLTIALDNSDDRYSNYDFVNARITPKTEAYTEDGTEWIQEEIFTVLDPVEIGDTIELTAYDDMYKADRAFASKLDYPATVKQLLLEVCDVCDIPVGSPTFKNETYQVQTKPEGKTARQIIGYIAQIACGNAVMQNGTLVIRSYDFGAFQAVTDGIKESELQDNAGYYIISDYPSEPNISTDNITITGISTKIRQENEDVTLVQGSDEYCLEIENPLIEGNEETALDLIGKTLIGTTICKFSGSFFSDPTMEFMDLVCLVDMKDHVRRSFLSNVEFVYLNQSNLSCDLETPAQRQAQYNSNATTIYQNVKRDLQQNKTEWEAAVDNLGKTLENASGMYQTEVAQEDGSTVTYIHDKKTLSQSKNVIKVTSEAIGLSSDGGKTFPYGLYLTGDLIARILYTIGINADYINSGSITVKDGNGNITFLADTATGKVIIKADEITISGKTVAEISSSIVSNFVETTYRNDLEALKSEIKNKIETWYQPSDPAAAWGTPVQTVWCDVNGDPIPDVNGNQILLWYEESKVDHEGDLWKNTSNNKEYRYENGVWVEMPIPDAVFDEIDGKAQIFVNTPSAPYRIGDLWFNTSSGDILTCMASRNSGFNASDWKKKNKYTDDSGLNTFVSTVYDPKIAELQSQLDGQLETWFYDYEPTLQNEPASNWTTTEQRKNHEGDLFFWKSTGYSYRFLQDGATWKWQLIQDTDVSKALAAAEKAQDTADHKRRVFVVDPQPPYDIGDLWVQGGNGDIMRCCVAKSDSAKYEATDWEKASKYTDDSRAEEVADELKTLSTDLKTQIDGKIETYSQESDPSSTWTTGEMKSAHTGDLWYNSKTETTKRWNGTAWHTLNDAEAISAKNLAITKKRVFTATPQPPYDVGDLWVGDSTSDLMRCVTAKASGNYAQADWIKATKYTDDSAVKSFIENTYNVQISAIQDSLDRKIETWYQADDPSKTWNVKTDMIWYGIDGKPILDVNGNQILLCVESEKMQHEGDLWHCTTDNRDYQYRNGSWVESSVPDEVFDKIDGKSQVFVEQPVIPYEKGDLWFTGTNVMVCISNRKNGQFTASDWQKKDNYTDDTTVEDFIVNTYNPKIADIQNQIDGKIDTYYYDYEPKLTNKPASDWTNDDIKASHNGDLFFWKTKGYTYRFLNVSGVWNWVRVKDSDIESAMETASKAQDTADGKRRVFISTPAPPYDVGDLWSQGSGGELMRCKTAKAKGSAYASTDWEKASKYTDDSKANEAIAQINIVNGKIESMVTEDDLTSIIEQSADSIRMQAKKLTWEAENSSLKEDGSFSCKNANISGNLTSSLDTEKYDFSSEISETVYLKRGVKTTGYGLNIKGKNKTSTSEKYGGLALIPCSDYYRFSQQNEENYTSCISANDKLIIQAQEVSDDTKAKYVSIEFDTAETPGLQMITSASQMVLFDIDQSGARFNSDRTMVNNLKLTTYKTVTESPNLYIDGTYYAGNYSGYVCKSSSSSRRYKTNITKVDEELNTDALYNLPVKSYTYKENYLSETDRNCGKRMIGFIAEDVDKIYPKACQYDEEGKPEMWNSKILIPAMLDLIQKQHVEIEKIKEKLNEK